MAAVTVNGVWQPPTVLDATGGARNYWPRASASVGEAFDVVWQRNDSTGVHVMYSRWTVDGGWTNPTVLTIGFNPTIAHDDSGNVVISYVDVNNGMIASPEWAAEQAKAISATDLPDTTAMVVKAITASGVTQLSATGKRAAGPQSAAHAGSVTVCWQEDDNGWQIVARTYASTEQPHVQFDDVPADRWSYAAVTAVVAAGLMSGETSSHFGATDPMTREQLAVVLARALARWH
jgi:hypothetical protein